jgi:hypothetical protein
MTRRETTRVKQLGKMHSIEDGRLQGPAGWEKLKRLNAVNKRGLS